MSEPHQNADDQENVQQQLVQSGGGPLSDKTGQDQSVKPKFVANYLALDVSFISNLPAAVLQKITARAEEMENLKSQQLLDQTNFEHSIHQSQHELSSMKERMENSLKEAEQLRTKLASIDSEKNNLEREYSTLRNRSSEHDDQFKSLQTRVDNLAQEKRQTLDTLERRNNELRELRSELEDNQKKHLDNRKTIVDLENQVQQARSTQMSARLREQQLSQEVESLKRSNEWFESELNAKSEEFKKFRTEKLNRISTLQSERDSFEADNSSLKITQDSLNKRLESMNKKYDDSLVKIQELKGNLAASEEGFKTEMSSQQRLCELWEKSANDAKSRVQELESALNRERNGTADELAKWKNMADKEKKRASKLESQLNNLEKQLGNMHGNGGGDDHPSTPAGPRTPARNMIQAGTPASGAAVLSPSAHIISEIQKGGGSLVQLYSDFQETKTRLEREKYKNEQLRREMDNILEEMENHAPAILAEREENRRLEVELADLSVNLEKSNAEVAELKDKLKSAEIKVSDSTREQGLLDHQVRDMSRQVTHLLIQIKMLADNESPLSAQDHQDLQNVLNGEEGESDTNRLISERLVLFKNIAEMQKQNEHLLKVTRELGEQMEAKEAEARKNIEEMESESVARAESAILKLQDDLQKTETKLEALTKERDMFRRMMQNRDSTNTNTDGATTEAASGQIADMAHVQQLIKQNEQANANMLEAQKNLETYRNETKITIDTLNSQITQLSNTRADLQLQLTKVQGQCELANDRFKNLQEHMEACKNENGELKKQNSSLQESLSKQDVKTQQVAQELVEARSLASSMKSEADNLKAEKAFKQSVEERLVKENSSLLEEKGRLNSIISNLQAQEGERSLAESESRQRLSSQIETLQGQVDSLQKKLEAETEEVKRITSRKEHESAEYQQRIDRLTADVTSVREELNNAKHSKDQAESRVREVELELKSSKEKLALYQGSGEQSTEVELTDRISSLSAELDKTRHELQMSEQHVREMTEVAKAAEESLESFSTTNDEFRQSMDDEIAKKDAEIKQLNEKLEGTEELLRNANEELANFRTEEAKKIKAAEDGKAALEAKIKQLEENEQRLNQIQEELKSDLERQGGIAKEAQENYESELVKHADAARSAQELRTELSQVKATILESQTQAKNATEQLSNNESSWNTQKYAYESEIEQLKSRCSNLVEQNKQMLEQLEKASSVSNRYSAAGGESSSGEQVEPVASDEATVGDASESHLRHIIRYLKQEKEIVEVNHELAKQESRRYKQQLDHTQSELDQAKLDLERQRQREDESVRVASEHEKILQQLNDINVLRESNSQLRTQSDYYSKRANELEAQVSDLQGQFEPLQEQLREAQSLNETHEQAAKQSQEEINQWRNRVQQILSKYERIDPAELQTLKDEVTKLKEQIQQLEAERDELKAKLDQVSKENNEKIAAITQERDAKNKENEEKIAALTKERDAKVEEVTDKEKKLQETTSGHEALQSRFERLRNESQEKLKRRRDETQTVKNELQQTKEECEALKKELEQVKASTAESNTQTDTNVSELQAELETTKAALREAKAVAEAGTTDDSQISEKQQKIDELQAHVESLSQQCEELKKQKDEAIANSTTVTVSEGEAGQQLNQLTEEKNQLTEEKNQLTQANSQLTDEKAKLTEEKANVVAEHESLVNEKSALELQLNEMKSEIQKLKAAGAGASAEGSASSTSDEEVKQLKEAHAAEIKKLEEDKEKSISEQVAKQREEVLKKMRLQAQNVIAEKVKNKEAEFKQKEEELQQQIKTLKESSSVGGSGGSDAQQIAKLKQEFEEEKKKAIKETTDKVRKELQMRITLLENKLKQQKPATGIPAPTQVKTGAGAATNAAQQQQQQQNRSIQIKGQETRTTAPGAKPAVNRPPATGAGASNLASRLPQRGGGVGATGRGGHQGAANRPAFKPRVSGESGQKRPASTNDQGGDNKRQKGS